MGVIHVGACKNIQKNVLSFWCRLTTIVGSDRVLPKEKRRKNKERDIKMKEAKGSEGRATTVQGQGGAGGSRAFSRLLPALMSDVVFSPASSSCTLQRNLKWFGSVSRETADGCVGRRLQLEPGDQVIHWNQPGHRIKRPTDWHRVNSRHQRQMRSTRLGHPDP